MIKQYLANKKVVFVIGFLFLIVLPVLNSIGVVSDLYINLFGRYFCFAIAAMAMDFIWGYTGVLSLCQAFFFCLGGYMIGMNMLLNSSTANGVGEVMPAFMSWNGAESLPIFWKPFFSFSITILLIILVTGSISLILSFLVFRKRVKGVYFSILTQAFALGMWLLFLRNETNLGGTNGLTDFKEFLGFDLTSPNTMLGLYAGAFLLMVTVYYGFKWLVHSHFGKLMIAVRESEHRLRFIGYSVTNIKVIVFVIAAIVTAFAGAMYVPQTGIVTPGRMTVQASIEIVIWAALGGRVTLYGPILGAILVSLLYSLLTGYAPHSWPYFLAFLFIAVVQFFPDGLAGILKKITFSKKVEPSKVGGSK